MRTNKRLLNRVLAFFLIFSFVISGLHLSNLDITQDVYAIDGGGAGGGGGGSKPGTGGDKPGYSGSGWRISLIPSETYLSEDNHSQIQATLENYKYYSILVTDGATRSNPIYMPVILDGSVRVIPSIRASNLQAIFPGAPGGYNPRPLGSLLKDGPNFTTDYWSTSFRDFIMGYENKDELVNCVIEYLKQNGFTDIQDPREIFDSISVSVEPVTFWLVDNIIIEFSFQDILGGDGEHNKTAPFFEALLNSEHPKGIQHSPLPAYLWANFPANMPNGSSSVLKLGNMSNLYSVFTEYNTGEELYNAPKSNPLWLDNGVLYFNLGTGTITPSSKAETNIVVAYDGVPGTSDGTLRVNQSHNFVTSENAPSIKAYTTDSEITTINEESYKLILSSYGSTFMNPFNTSKSDSLEGLVDRLSDSAVSFFDDYVVSYGGSYKVNTAKADNASITSNLINPLNDYINRLSSESVSWQNQPIEGGSFNIGSKKALSLGENKKPNDIASEIQQLSPFRDGTLKAVTASKIYSDILPDADPKPIVVNLALAALGGSRFGEFNTSTYTATEDNTYGLSIEFLTKKVPVTSYIAYATVDLTTGTAMLGRNESVTYDASGSGTFEIECDETAIFVAVPNTGSYSLEIEKTLSFFAIRKLF